MDVEKRPVKQNGQVVNMELPEERASMFELKDIVRKVVNHCYSDLAVLMETLPGMSEVERKKRMLQYVMAKKSLLSKLLVLVKWAADSRSVQISQNIMAYLANQNHSFVQTVDNLFNIQMQLPQARVRNYDLLSTIDILTTGTYQRFPGRIKSLLPPKPLTDEETLNVLERLEDVIRIRLLTEESLPPAMSNYSIRDGRAYFTIPFEFEVAVTLVGPANDSRWHIVSLDFLVDGNFSEGKKSEAHMNKLIAAAHGQMQARSPEDAHYLTLARMYDFLHVYALTIRLEGFYAKSLATSRTLFSNQIQVQMSSDRTVLRVGFWSGASRIGAWASPAFPKTIGEGSTPSTEIRENSLEIRLIEREDTPIASIQLDTAGETMIHAEGYPKAWLRIAWESGYIDLLPEDNVYDASQFATIETFRQLGIESMLLTVIRAKAHGILEKLKNTWIEEAPSAGYKPYADDVEFIETGKWDNTSSTSMTLKIKVRRQLYLEIQMDLISGGINIARSGREEGINSDSIIQNVRNRVNEDPAHFVDHISWYNHEIILEEISALANQLGMSAYRQVAVKTEDITSLIEASDLNLTSQHSASHITHKYPHRLFLQFTQFPDFHILIVIANMSMRMWLISSDRTDQSSAIQTLTSSQPIAYKNIIDIVGEGEVGNQNSRKRKRINAQDQDDADLGSFMLTVQDLAKIESFGRAWIAQRKLEKQLKDQGVLYHVGGPPKSLQNSSAVRNFHGKIPVIWVQQQDLFRGKENAPKLKYYVILKIEGWWSCGKSDCFVTAELPYNAGNLFQLELSPAFHHIRIDKERNVISLTYQDLQRCLMQLMEDMEKVAMMTFVAMQAQSIAKAQQYPQFEIAKFDMNTLDLNYGRHFVLKLRWHFEASKQRTSHFVVALDCRSQLEDPDDQDPVTLNPHRHLLPFIQDTLNQTKSLGAVLSFLHHSLDLFQRLDQLIIKHAEAGTPGKMLILPRSVKTFRLLFANKYGLDVRFCENNQLLISDCQEANSDMERVRLLSFPSFATLLATLDEWIPKAIADSSNAKFNNPTASYASTKQGFLCSGELAPIILEKLDDAVTAHAE